MNKPLTVTALHILPGRLRLRLSAPPQDVQRFTDAIKGHEGLDEVVFTPITLSVLIRYQRGHLTTEEVMLRAALAFSVEHGDRPVEILRRPNGGAITDGAFFSAVLVGVAAVTRSMSRAKSSLFIEKASGLGTAAAVVQHGWLEMRQRGYFDPELLSVAYLYASAARGAWLRGAAITWALCFGRHLFVDGSASVEIRPLKKTRNGDDAPHYEIVLVPRAPHQAPLFGFARLALQYLASAAAPGGNLFEEMRNVSRAHGEIIEGLGATRYGVPLTFSR